MRGAIQLHTLRALDEPIRSIVDQVGETAFEGVEFATRADEASATAIGERLDSAGVEPVAAHVPIDELEADLDRITECARAIGYDDVVAPWLDPEHFETVDAVEDAADRLSVLAERLDEAGLALHYHNHDQEFQQTDDGLAIHVLADRAPEITLQVDVGWVQAAGEDPVDFVRLNADRIDLVHLKDVTPAGEGVSAGDGDVDLRAVADVAREADVDWLVYENDQPDDPLAELDHAADTVSGLV